MYSLKYAETAEQDLTDIFDRIASESRNAAIKYLEEIEQSLLRLTKFPNLGQKAKYKELAEQGIRVLVHDKYLIFYIVDSEIKAIDVIRVLHSSRDYVHLL